MKNIITILLVIVAISYAEGCNHRGNPLFIQGCPVTCPPGTYPFRTARGCACVPCTQTFTCPVGSIWNPSLCRCTCAPPAVPCPANFFQSPLYGCLCVCNIASCFNGLPVNPATCSCPPF